MNLGEALKFLMARNKREDARQRRQGPGGKFVANSVQNHGGKPFSTKASV